MQREDFTKLIKSHQGLIYKICRTYCQEAVDRKDLEQEILMQFWLSLKRYDGRVKMSTWLYKVALNTAISFQKKVNKSKSAELNEQIIHLTSNAEEQAQNEQIELLYHFISQLNELDKALMLLYLDSYKQDEIAQMLGITATNVATKISRIKKRLKTKFEKSLNT